ncbi:hypothetical protein D910_08697 [Dendroctonus ponderosae]|uniref:Major facilitator superfamily (MFS) profile domain-containing protein n=1 Tax=Dendroctonus ponderosae TaxID=77166 RepID=U4UMY8_DENPD|nr:hypothetical protein D910_08697 [Dendroctonus ponderosae]
MPSSLSAFNAYFDKRMAVMMSICQALMIAFSMGVPQLAAWSMVTFGFRGTLLGLAVLSCLSLPAVASLQSVEKHLRKVALQMGSESKLAKKSVSIDMPLQSPQEKPLMPLGGSLRSLQQHQGRRRMSMLSLGDRVASVISIHQDISKEEAILQEIHGHVPAEGRQVLEYQHRPCPGLYGRHGLHFHHASDAGQYWVSTSGHRLYDGGFLRLRPAFQNSVDHHVQRGAVQKPPSDTLHFHPHSFIQNW